VEKRHIASEVLLIVSVIGLAVSTFGSPSPFWWLPWLFGGLVIVSGAAMVIMQTPSYVGRTTSAAGTKDAATPEQRQQNWDAIDSLVQEFIPEAIRRGTRMQGHVNKHWVVRSAQSKCDALVIFKNGHWRVHHEDGGYIFALASSRLPKKGLRETNVVEGLREGAAVRLRRSF
jgi:hypothetical protein